MSTVTQTSPAYGESTGANPARRGARGSRRGGLTRGRGGLALVGVPVVRESGTGYGGSAGAPASELGLLAEKMLALAIATRSTEALLLRAQAGLLAWLAERNRFERCSFVSLNDLAVEVLQIRPRTARERLALHRLFQRHPEVERAFLAGKVTACQVLAAAPLFGDRDRSAGSAGGNDTAGAATGAARGGTAGAATGAAADSVLPTEAIASLSVREIRQLVRERAASPEESPEAPEGRTISFQAPAGFQLVFDEILELSRMVLGRDAPVYECLEAMLLETHWLGIHPQEKPPRVPSRRTISVRPRSGVPHRAEAIAHARETLEQVRAYMEDVRDLIESGEPKSAHDAIARLRQVHLLRSPQRVLFARLLRDLRRTQAMDLLGYRSMADLVEDRLRLSERSARSRVAESLLFETDEGIARAFAAGEISIMQAHLIQRQGSSAARQPFVERAREVTWRQLQREYRLLELKCDLEQVARKPFPQGRVEEALIEALGGDRAAIEEELRERGIAPAYADGSSDPAENPPLMDRLEVLVDMLVRRQWDEIPRTGAADRQTSAAARPEVTVRFWAPRQLADDIEDVMRRFRKLETPWLPMWAAMTLLFARAAAVWELQDPEHVPVRSKILKRDRYRCVIPGCTRRRQLEVSHNRPRSQGGTDDPGNLSVVCHAHHQRGLHGGTVSVTGRAPDALEFMLGLRQDGPPLLIYKGYKLVKGAFGPVTGPSAYGGDPGRISSIER
jgi:hypothetical protein